MPIKFCISIAAITLSTFLLSLNVQDQNPKVSAFIKVQDNGKLQYIPDAQGNIIPDFSRVGYRQGLQKFPKASFVITLSPAKSGSSQQHIQEAINSLSQRQPDANGIRGAIFLKKGIYEIPGSLYIDSSGILLQGAGADCLGTQLRAVGTTQRSLLRICGQGQRQQRVGSKVAIAEDYVPVGAFSFRVHSTEGLLPGSQIVVLRPGTQQWIADLQMNTMEQKQGLKQWQAAEYDLHFERTVTKIEGNRIFIDNPIVQAMEPKYGGGYIYQYEFKQRIHEVGISDINFESAFMHDTDEAHAWIAVQIDKAENCWIKNISAQYFGYAAVSIEKDAKYITVEDAKSENAKSQITGGRRYSFNNNGQLNLFKNLSARDGRHDFVTGARVLGPNVFYNCEARSTHADIGPHHRWAVGTLYDNVSSDGDINIQDRGNWGSGHGWAGVTQVLWNCKARSATVQSPWVSGKNYNIGFQGAKKNGRLANKPDGEWEGHNQTYTYPKSLYAAQLEERRFIKSSFTE